jgi:predicted KAP-like P-loop ATPase
MSEKKERLDLVIHDTVDDLTAPLCASVELSKAYVEIEEHVRNLQKQTRTIKDDDGHVTVIENPQLLKWQTLRCKILDSIAKLNANLETKHIEMKIDAAAVVMANLDKLPEDAKVNFLKNQAIFMKTDKK